ncbi:unnamed protein product [Brachionus calyciflorus]|uniref:Uncharacterized protein n=1 Tax=Brachionus calyciflorus TaxID=104777 RepID=A0A814I093_9BILA|nr:unnamed protein product [Brachionus calyciflorus]
MSRRLYRYLDEDEDDYEIVYARQEYKPKIKYVYDDNDDKTKYVYDDNDDDEQKFYIIHAPRRRRSAEKVYVYENEYEDFLDDDFSYKYQPEPPQRVYFAANSRNTNKSKSVEQLSPRKQPVYQSKNTLHKNILNQKMKKMNHRREIDEPEIRDKPISNKPVIYGGAVVYK